MRKPSFGFLVVVLTVLSLLGIVAKAYRDFIPPGAANRLASEPGEFMKQASFHKVDWYPLGATVLSEARRLDRPIMLVIGTPWSRIGRSADDSVFIDPDVVAYLQRGFVCIRIDALQKPYWMNLMWPVSRPMIGASPDYQIWFLEPTCEVIGSYLIRSPKDQLDPNQFLGKLIEVNRALNNIRRNRQVENSPQGIQAADLEHMNGATANSLDFDAYASAIGQLSDPKYGGFTTKNPLSSDPGYQRLLPFALRFHLLREDTKAFDKAVEHAVRSPIIDWLDGGFYLRSLTRDWIAPTYDKVAVNNAELMQVFATAAVLCKNAYYERLAKDIFDCLATEFMEDDLIRACRVGDENLIGRSAHSSFPPRILRPTLTQSSDPSLYLWAQRNLGLRVETNHRMLPYVSDPTLLEREPQRFNTVIGLLRKANEERPSRYAGIGLSEVSCLVAARMLAVCRIWNDENRSRIARRLFEECSRFLDDDDVAIGYGLSGNSSTYLGSYLAYADAALQDYLESGRISSFESGMRVIARARHLFRTEEYPWWILTTDETYLPLTKNLCDIADSVSESCTARMIRLCNAYGRLLRDSSKSRDLARTTLAFTITQDAISVINQLADPAFQQGPQAAGFFCASFDALFSTQAYAVGTNAIDQANEIYRQYPIRFVAPCYGKVRRDLQQRAPGVYLVNGASVMGPYSVDEALNRLKTAK